MPDIPDMCDLPGGGVDLLQNVLEPVVARIANRENWIQEKRIEIEDMKEDLLRVHNRRFSPEELDRFVADYRRRGTMQVRTGKILGREPVDASW